MSDEFDLICAFRLSAFEQSTRLLEAGLKMFSTRIIFSTDLRISLQRTGEMTGSNLWTSIASNHFGPWVPPATPVSISEVGANPLNVTVTDSRTNFPPRIIG